MERLGQAKPEKVVCKLYRRNEHKVARTLTLHSTIRSACGTKETNMLLKGCILKIKHQT